MRHYVIDGMKVCARCGINKSVAEFSVRKRGSTYGVHSYCNTCKVEDNRERSLKRSSSYNREANLKSKFGLTLADFSAMLDSQGGACAICRKVSDKVLRVDHCHKSGNVRSLLCSHCNTLLGMAFDNKEILLSAVKYLEAHNESSKPVN